MDKFMPPTRDQFEKKFGDTILADYDDDEEDEPVSRGGRGDPAKDEEPPKPTADVMMSRNLKGGVGKNFNFAFSSDDSQESPALKDKDQSQSDEDDVSQP